MQQFPVCIVIAFRGSASFKTWTRLWLRRWLLKEGWITPDTMGLSQSSENWGFAWKSIVYYAMDDKNAGLRSDRMRWKGHNKTMEFKFCQLFCGFCLPALSDQRLPISLLIPCHTVAILSLGYFKNITMEWSFWRIDVGWGSPVILQSEHQPVKLTQMQQLLCLFSVNRIISWQNRKYVI